jgi:hypothetical protein
MPIRIVHGPVVPSVRGIALLTLVLGAAVPALAQQPEGLPADWKKTETAAEKDFKEPLADSGVVDAKIRGFLTEKALPQLALESNRPTIEKTRRRMRDFLLGGIEEPKAFDDVSKVILDFMTTLARDPKAEAVVRVNAMLLIGELRGRDNKQPWFPATPALSAAVADPKLPPEVRVAALAGLARHLEAARAAGVELPDAKAADALAGVITLPPGKTDQAATNWMLSRALGTLPAAMPTLPKEIAAGVVKVLEDPSRPFDVRVRAAAALGAAAKQQSGVDAAKAVTTIQAIASGALKQDLDGIGRQREEEVFTVSPESVATDAPKEKPAAPATLSELACRRNAWRLVTLADALATDDGVGGLASILGKSGDAARKLSETLRTQGLAIDADPTQAAVEAAVQAVGPPPPAGSPAAPAQPSTTPPAAKPGNAADPDNPFAK